MGKRRLGILLPTAAALVSVPLMIWDAYNTSVITSMGMAWDIGPPIWPYQTPAILLYSLNFPAHFVFQPVANSLRLYSPTNYLLLLPATLLWWRYIGLRLEKRPVQGPYRYPRFVSATLIVVSGILLWAALKTFTRTTHWWFTYGSRLWSTRAIRLIEFMAPGVWCVILASLAVIGAKRVIRHR